jgi:formylglycine-generating enzyme required for sulfatase activity
MTDDSLSGFQALPLTARYTIDRLCTRFEAACQSGPPPSLEGYLNELAPGYQPVLLAELLDLDVEYRRRRGEAPYADEYSQRFPAFSAVVADVFARRAVDTLPETVKTQTVRAAPAESESPKIPGFEVVAELGRGGMGIVYKARQKSLGRDVALKVLKAPGSAGLEDRVRFRLEAEAVARLRHPNIVQVYESGEYDGRPYLVLELVEGKSLREFVGEPVDPWASARLVETLARAVHHAHTQGVIHRDLKPANVLLDTRHETRDTRTDPSALVSHVSCLVSGVRVIPKVADFGLAKRVGNDTWQSVDGQLIGTPAYMAPEQVGGEVGPESDVYALGVTLYELLTGRVPLAGKDAMDTLLLSQFQEAPPPRKLQPKMPRDLDTICMKCLRKAPRERYATAEALADDLRRFLNREPIRARRVSPAERAWKWARRNPALASLVVTVVGLVVAVAIVSTTYAARLKAEQTALKEEQKLTREAEQARRVAVANAVETAAPGAVPPLVATLADSPAEVLPLLQDQFDTATGLRKLRAAVALTALGRPQPDFLLARVSDAPAAEGGNLALAFRAMQNADIRAQLTTRFHEATDLTLKARCALLLADLGDGEAIRSMFAPGPNPEPRSTVFDVARDWHGDLAAVPALLKDGGGPRSRSERATRVADSLRESASGDGFRSGLCTMVGHVDPATLDPVVKSELIEVLATLYRDDPDGGTHSAADWALRRWGVELPAIEAGAGPVGPRRWFVNQAGMTMIGVGPGAYEFRTSTETPTVTVLSHPYFLGAREVTVAEFRRFMADREVPADEQPTRPVKTEPDPAAPVSNIFWHEIPPFCNWLSRRDGRRPYYRREGAGWTEDKQADGYRLPTEAEWDFAQRAGATTTFHFGADARWLTLNARVASTGPAAVGTRMPNRWGLFDMTGNVWEWCSDRSGPDLDRDGHGMVGLRLDPPGPPNGPARVLRGGAFDSGSYDCHSRFRLHASGLQRSYGFRVACSGAADPPETDGKADVRRQIAVFTRALADVPGQPLLLRARAELAVRVGDWAAAAADLRATVDRDPRDHHDWRRCAALLLMAKDEAGYREFRGRMLQRFADTTDALVTERIAKACLLAAGTPEEVAAATAVASRALTAPDVPDWGVRYAEFVRGLAAYRAGDAGVALTWLEKCQTMGNRPVVMRQVLAQAAAVEAMAHRLRKDEAAARKALDRAAELHRPDAARIGDGTLLPDWQDVLMTEALLREAGER